MSRAEIYDPTVHVRFIRIHSVGERPANPNIIGEVVYDAFGGHGICYASLIPRETHRSALCKVALEITQAF